MATATAEQPDQLTTIGADIQQYLTFKLADE